MPRKKKRDWNGMVKAIGVLMVLLLISGAMLHWSNENRAEEGWFTAGSAITINNFAYVIFFSTLTGTVIAIIVSTLLRMMGIKQLK